MRRVLATFVLLGSLGAAEAQVPRGTPILIEFPTNVLPSAMGANGFVVAGAIHNGAGFYWMPTSGVVPIGGIGATAVSLDGKTIAGSAFDPNGKEQAAIWQGGSEWRLLGSFPNAASCDRNLSSTYGLSGDGRVVVGLAWNGCAIAHAFRWEASTGLVDLGAGNVESSRANGISADGSVVFGWVEASTGFRMGAKWVDKTQTLIQGPQGMVGEAFAASRDGSLITGTGCNPSAPIVNSSTGWRWTADKGVECLEVPRPRWLKNLPYQTLVFATSDDGRVMGGSYSFGLDAEALVWFDGQHYFLKDYLQQNGIPDAFEGWVNTGFVQALTPDGRTLVGYGAGPTGFQGYMVVLPEMGDR